MNLYEKLVEASLPLARAKKIKRVCVGIYSTLVEIEKEMVGLVSTFWDFSFPSSGLGNEVNFWNEPADLVIKKYLSFHPIEVSVGLATINAVFSFLNFNKYNLEDPLSKINLSLKDEVIMIGYLEDFFNKLKSKVKKIWIFDIKELENLKLKIPSIERVKLAILSSYLLLTKNLEKVLKEIEGISEVVLTGIETPINPEIFKGTSITWLSGFKVKDKERLFKGVCEGKGVEAFLKTGLIERVNVKVK